MVENLKPSFTSIQAILDAQGLSSDKAPNLEEWLHLLTYLDKREKQIKFLRQTTVDIPNALVFIFDEDMTIVAANTEAAVSLGFKSEHEIIGKHANTFIKADDYDASLDRFDAIMRGETLPAYERTLKRPDGTVIHTILNLSPLENADTGAKFVKSVMRDVTSLRVAQVEAQRTQDYLQKVLENAPIILWACDATGLITLSHGLGLNALGHEAGESVGTSIFERYAENEHIIDLIKKTLWGEKQHTRIELKNTVFDSRFHPIFEDDDVIGIVGVATDITELASTQQRIQAIQDSTERTRDYLQAILNNSSDGIAVTSLTGEIQQTNPAFNQLFNLNPDQAFGQQLYEYLATSEKSIFESTITYVIREKKSLRFEAISINDNHESDFFIDISCSPILTGTNDLNGLIFSLRDISAYQELLKSLAESRDEALQASRLKSEFLAMMSHEVRTPLHAVMGVAEMVQDTNLEAEQRELVDLIQEQSQNLLVMLNSILDYSKLEAQKMILERRAFKVKEFMEAATNQFKGQAWNKGIKLQIFIDAPDNLYIYGDTHRLRQVITAFISNAIKFTNHGEVIVTCILHEKTETQVTLHFGIADTGIGIPEEKIPTLFSPFTQADTSHTRHYGGTGLGLAIAHRILKLMKSTIQVTSIVDDGTIFEFEISFDRANLRSKE